MLNRDEGEKERRSESVPDVIVEARYGEDEEEEDEELSKKMEAVTLKDKGVCKCAVHHHASVS